MILRDYLYFNKIQAKDFAKKIGYSPNHIYGYNCGKTRFSKKGALKIQEETQGQVSAEEIMQNNPKFVERVCPHCKKLLSKER